MRRQTIIYFFTVILFTAVVLPTYISLSEQNCEVSHNMDDTDGDENIKEFEINLFISSNYLSSNCLNKSQGIHSYIGKTYISVDKTLEYPPPELYI